ncbi:hypothetical protein [Bartonella grahamii]|nr:hypothetical protein [Bartonella grahamii]
MVTMYVWVNGTLRRHCGAAGGGWGDVGWPGDVGDCVDVRNGIMVALRLC